MKKVYICEDNIDNIFTVIYEAWDARIGHDNVKLLVKNREYNNDTLELFTQYHTVKTDDEKAEKVARSIKNKISLSAYQMVSNAICVDSMEKADIIYRFLIIGFHIGASVVDYLNYESVMKLFEYNRKVVREQHHYLGFVRFVEDENKILISKIAPDSDIIRMIAPHFTDRLSKENFIIYDEKRNTAVIHRSDFESVYIEVEDNKFNEWFIKAEQEETYSKLWKIFFTNITIKERENYELQRNNIPLKYRKYMNEFQNGKK